MSSNRPDGATRLGVVMPVHNRRELTLRCLRSISHVTTDGLDVQIFVVDDGSTDGTAQAIAKSFPQVQVVSGDGSLHYAAGTNRGISAALDWGAEYVIAMNDDSVVHPHLFPRLIFTARKLDRAIIGALLLLLDAPHKVFQVSPVWRTGRGGWQLPEDLTAFSVPGEPFPVETIVGNCVIYPREAIEECGLMDEVNFPHGWGDVQYIARMKKAGWHLYVDPAARVWCEPNTYPEPLHTQSLSSVARTLLRDERHPQNLKRQFVARWHSAPTRTKALGAFAIHLCTLVTKALGIGLAPPAHPSLVAPREQLTAGK